MKTIQNFHKICDLVDKNFETRNKTNFYIDIIKDDFKFDFMDQKELVLKIRNAFGRQKFSEMLIVDTNFNFFTLLPLMTALNIFDKDNDRETFHNILQTFFKSNERQSLSLIIAASFPQIFQCVLRLYKKYISSWNDLQSAIMLSSSYDIIGPTQYSTYSHYKKLIKNVFGNNTSHLAAKIERFLNELDGKLEFDLTKIINLNDFLFYVFNNNVTRVANILKTIFRKRWIKMRDVNGMIDYSYLKYLSNTTKNERRDQESLRQFNENSYCSKEAFLDIKHKLNREIN